MYEIKKEIVIQLMVLTSLVTCSFMLASIIGFTASSVFWIFEGILHYKCIIQCQTFVDLVKIVPCFNIGFKPLQSQCTYSL
jgi:hypothetical protein